MSSDSDEFYDAEDNTPHKHSKKNLKTAEDKAGVKANTAQANVQTDAPMEIKEKNEENFEKNVMEGRKKFRELRQLMQTDDDDGGQTNHSTPESQNSSVEGVFPAITKAPHPFRIIEHDAMSLQSMTSLGRIGRILGGSVESSTANAGKEPISNPSASSREPSGKLDVKPSTSQPQGQIPMQEPDVIASTKANSLKHSRTLDSSQSIMAMSDSGSGLTNSGEENLPVAPPRRRKKAKVSTSQSMCSPDSDSVGSMTQMDKKLDLPLKPPPLQNLYIQPPSLTEILSVSSSLPLPSPASTIESLTREFQNSLDLENASLNKGVTDSGASAKSNTSRPLAASAVAITTSSSSMQNSLDIRAALKGQYVVKPQDEEKARASGPSAIELERLGRLRSPESRASVPRTTGHSSLGAVHSNNGNSSRASLQANWAGGTGGRRERRRSAGDEGALRQLNMLVRTRTDSGKQLTDMEILEQVTVLNLDTGERVPLSVAEDKIPQCINPLSLHIMRLTSEYVSNSSIYDEDKNRESDDENMTHSGNGSRGNGGKEGSGTTGRGTGVTLGADGNAISSHADEAATGGLRRKTAKFKRFLGSTVKKTMDKAKSIAQEVSHARHKEDISDIIDEVHGEHNIKLKASNSHKGPYDFEGCMRHVQEITNWHSGPVWCMKFSACGRLLATAGQDRLLRVWVLRDAQEFFQDMRTKYNADQKSSPTPSQESLGPGIVGGAAASTAGSIGAPEEPPGPAAPFAPLPFCSYSGHTSDLLDVAWSKNYFILSSSMDKTVRLWHISRGECLCCFQHIDFVTAIAFHPRDDRYFLSGSLDGKLRLWNIPDKKVAVWNEVDGQTKLITAANFCQNGKFAVVGTYDGRCIFYTTDQLKYHTQIDVRSTRGKNSTGRKISGIEPMPGEDKILVTSNDSRIRLYDLRDLNLSCKYKGYVNISSQIKASFSHDGKYIVSGSENQCIYIWKTHHDYSKFSSVRRDRNDFWEGIKAHNAVVTCAVFAPNPESILRMIEEREREARAADASDDNPGKEITNPVTITGHILVSADFTGCIRVFVNKAKPKHSSLPASAMA